MRGLLFQRVGERDNSRVKEVVAALDLQRSARAATASGKPIHFKAILKKG